MRWWTGLLTGVAVAGGTIAFRAGGELLAADRCLDSGGAYYGELGCQHAQLPRVERLVVDKSRRLLSVYSRGKLIQSMPVSLGREPRGDKVREGDNRTPEGIYPVVAHKPDSAYYRALRLGYPTQEQRKEAEKERRDPGGDIMIHGLPNGLGWLGSWHRLLDWTRGCVALTDGEMLWLYRTTPDGTPVEIRP